MNFLWTASKVLIKFICEGFQTGDAYLKERLYIYFVSKNEVSGIF